MIALLQAADIDSGWIAFLTPIVANGWALAAASIAANVWLIKRALAKSDAIEADRDRINAILGTRAEAKETT